MNARDEFWYIGNYEEYRELPWLHEMYRPPRMPWKVERVSPMGYIVFVSSGGTRFKMLNNPTVVEGDVIV